MIFVFIFYYALIGYFIMGLRKAKKPIEPLATPNTKFSIVIPFRNEATNMPKLLESLIALNYPQHLFELILINDDSNDNSLQIIKNYAIHFTNIMVIDNQLKSISPKKDAIACGIAKASHEWIITTDADCSVQKDWLLSLNHCIIDQKPVFIAGEIGYPNNKNFVENYQYYDNLSLSAISKASFLLNRPIMCNAANMAFLKSYYLDFVVSQKILTTSGDDIFLLEYFSKYYPDQLCFNYHPNGLVYTQPEKTFTQVIQQRIRWASKSIHYQNVYTKIIGIVVLLTQLSIVVGLFIFPITTIGYWLLKIMIDGVIIKRNALLQNTPFNALNYLKTASIHPFITTYVGIKSLLGKYEWKERKFYR